MFIFRSSVAAFYLVAGRRRYRSGPFHRARFGTCLLRRNETAEVKSVVRWMPEILLATEITLGGLHGCMPQQELDCSSSPPLLWQSFAQVLRKSWGAMCS